MRACADGSRPRTYIKYDKTVALPKVLLEALFETVVVSAHEERDVVPFDLPGAFHHVETLKDKNVYKIAQ